jgi:hypothetical protein
MSAQAGRFPVQGGRPFRRNDGNSYFVTVITVIQGAVSIIIIFVMYFKESIAGLMFSFDGQGPVSGIVLDGILIPDVTVAV